jgi:hypothetical protein
MMNVLAQKLGKRGVDVGCMKDGKVKETGNKARQTVTIGRDPG